MSGELWEALTWQTSVGLDLGIDFLILTFYLVIQLFMAVPLRLWDLSSPTRDRTGAQASESAES